MVELKKSLLLHILKAPSGWTSSRRANAVTTALMLADQDGDSSLAAYYGIRAGRYQVDSKLLEELYEICPKGLRVGLVRSSPFRYLRPSSFEPRFVETYRDKRLSVSEREDLALSLESYLWRHPSRGRQFESEILALLRSKQWEYRLRGLKLVSHLDAIAERDLKLIARAMRDPSPEIRMQACNGLSELTRRRSELSPRLRAFCMSPELKELSLRLYRSDPNADVRTCAYYWLKAREPRVRRPPPKGMAIPPPRRKRQRRAAAGNQSSK